VFVHNFGLLGFDFGFGVGSIIRYTVAIDSVGRSSNNKHFVCTTVHNTVHEAVCIDEILIAPRRQDA
jgi:hypothetical protein